MLLVAAVVGLAALQRGATAAISRPVAGCALAAPVVLLLIYFDSRRRGAPLAAAIAAGLARMRQFLEAASHAAELTWQRDQERIKAEFEATVQGINREWRNAVRGAMGLRDTRPAEVDRRAANIKRKYQARRSASFERLSASHAGALAALHGQAREDAARFAADQAAKMQSLDRETQSRWRTLEEEWRNTILPVFERLRSASAETEKMFPEWEPAFWGNWTPPGDFPDVARFGRLEIDIKQFVETAPKDKRLAFPEEKVSAPLMLAFPREGSILFETTKGGENEAVAAINNVIFRLLAAMPPGKASFTIFDPVGLGQNFAALMHLADYEESYINSRIWTQTSQFEEKLAELTEHMEKVIQMYLRNEYPTIAEYNAQAGTIAEKYHFLVVASFPVNFSDTAARRLRNIAANGARCGVYTLLHWDQRQPPPNEFVPDELRENAVRISRGEDRFYLADCHPAGIKLILDKPPSPEFATQLLHDIGRASGDATRVEVPFKEVTPPEGQMWSEETVEELRVPIGRSGAAKFQYLEIGKGTRQHALIAGKTGSGKSTLFHVIITNLALWCGPDQVEFYLVDFKKGVEFKCYAS
ncbi:MAG: ATP-binding protein, partial [Verrucomicrobia bacterium]|nr:ATP-binding protein [Verrucomicrobiota bacterium]